MVYVNKGGCRDNSIAKDPPSRSASPTRADRKSTPPGRPKSFSGFTTARTDYEAIPELPRTSSLGARLALLSLGLITGSFLRAWRSSWSWRNSSSFNREKLGGTTTQRSVALRYHTRALYPGGYSTTIANSLVGINFCPLRTLGLPVPCASLDSLSMCSLRTWKVGVADWWSALLIVSRGLKFMLHRCECSWFSRADSGAPGGATQPRSLRFDDEKRTLQICLT